MAFNSIRARMTLAFAAIVATLMLVVCGGMVWYARHASLRSADDTLKGISQRIATDQPHGKYDYADLLEDNQEDLARGVVLRVIDPAGRTMVRSQRFLPAWPRKRDDGWRAITVPYGRDTVVIELPWSRTERILQEQALALFGLGLLVVAVAGLGAWILVGRTLTPIDLLSRQAQAASVDSLHVNLSPPSGDTEIVRLVGMLNGLLARLSMAAAARGRFHAAASHELRTPLQALSGHLELALQRPRTEAEYRDVVREALTQTRRLTSLTQDLLLLHQLAAVAAPTPEAISLSDLCDRVLSACGVIVRAQRLRTECDLPADIVIHAPSTHAEMLVRNLVENAVKYADPGGLVWLRLVEERDGARLDIFNACAPQADWNSDRLFEPFYRPDASRSSRTGGTGLGLAICKALADVNGWRLTLHQEAGGVTASVLFSYLS